MARVRVRAQLYDETINVFIRELKDPRERSRKIAEVAKQMKAEADAQNAAILGAIPASDRYVDGRHNAPEETVRPDGTIFYEYHLLEELFSWIGEQLVLHSPIGQGDDPRPGHPGLYRRSHIFTADGNVVPPGQPAPVDASEWWFASTVPYARKMERGLSAQAPHGVYHAVAALAAEKWGGSEGIARIRYTQRDLRIGDIEAWANVTKSGEHRKSDRAEWLRRQPAIVITLKET